MAAADPEAAVLRLGASATTRTPPTPRRGHIATEFHEPMSGAYDAEIADRYLRFRPARQPSKFGRLDDTVIVVVADHGESLGEHAEQARLLRLRRDRSHPLIIAGPGVRACHRRQVRIVDVMPTALELLGVDVPGRFRARR